MQKFKNEYEYLVHLIKCTLQDLQPIEKPKELSFDKVLKYGKEHEVANIAFVSVERLCTKPNDDVYSKWKTVYAFSIQRHANQMNVRNKIVAALNDVDIRHIEAQGTIMKKLYSHPEWRMMSDIDFIIDKENLNAAEEVMKGLGYKTKNPNGVEVDAYGKNGIAVELHSDFFDPNSLCYGTISNPFSMVTQTSDTYSYSVSDTAFYLYNLLHCIKHYLQRGAGIRRIMDLYLMKEKLAHRVDFQLIEKVLTENRYKDVANDLFAVADKWFGDGNIESSIDLSQIEESIYLANNHGTAEIQLNNEYKRSAKNKFNFKLHKCLSLIFASKENIYRAYPFCQKHNYPIVLCWLHRGFCVLFSTTKRNTAFKLIWQILNVKIFK